MVGGDPISNDLVAPKKRDAYGQPNGARANVANVSRSSPNLKLLREQRYRKHFLVEDRRQATYAFGTAAVAYFAALPNDFLLFEDRVVLFVAVVSRVLFSVGLGGAILLLRRAQLPRKHDYAIHMGLIVIGICMSVNLLVRLYNGIFIGPLLATSVLLCLLYFVLRGPILPRVITGAIESIVAYVLMLHANPPLEKPAYVAGFIALTSINVVGVLSARAFEDNRRKRFDAERRERHALQELAVQKERAEALSHARAAFLASMSHEFRTPMNAVIGLSDLLLDAPMNNEHWRHVRTINDSARALLGLLNDILDFAKIDAQKINLSNAPFDLHVLAASVVEMLGPQAKKKNLVLRLDIAPDVPEHFLGDDARLRQVLLNLASNAVKFTDQGWVTLQIQGQPTNENKYELFFHVQDTGIGMLPEFMARLFQPFEQADVGIARRHEGSGLGLAISKQIVQAMAGDIRVESEKGRGSVFSFQVRLERAATVNPDADPVRVDNRPPLHILVVDDNEINREVARTRLGRLGYRIDLANDGPSAIEAVLNKTYDVVFMDLRMPQMSGIEATACIVERLAGQRLPHIIALTASVFEEDREACRRVGMCDFVGKPIDLAQMDAVLRRVANERGASAPRGIPHEPQKPISISKLRELHPSGDSPFFQQLSRLFLSEFDKRVPRMKEALGRRELHVVEDDAHSLKSTSAAVGALEMADLCAKIESAAHKERIEEIQPLIDALVLERPSVEQAFVEVLQSF